MKLLDIEVSAPANLPASKFGSESRWEGPNGNDLIQFKGGLLVTFRQMAVRERHETRTEHCLFAGKFAGFLSPRKNLVRMRASKFACCRSEVMTSS